MALLAGDTDITGADAGYFFTDASLAATKYTAVAGGTAETMSTQVRESADTADIKLAVWADSAGVPGALLGVTSAITDIGVGQSGLKTASFTSTFSVTSGTAYWLGFVSYGATFNGYGKLSVGQVGRDLTAGTSTAPNPFGSLGYTDNPPAKGIAISIDGTLAGGGGQTVTAPVAVAIGDMVTPAVGSPNATVVAPVMDALGDFPDTGMIVSVEVITTPMAAVGDMTAPTVSGTSAGAVTAPVAAAAADLVAPAVSAGSGVTALVADATGDLTAPAVSAGAAVTAPVADAEADMRAPIQVGAPQDRFRLGLASTGGVLVSGRNSGGNEPAHATGGTELLGITGGAEVVLV